MKKGILNRFLDWIEKAGNRLPDPLTLFFYLCVLVIVASAVASWLDVQVVHPGDQRIVEAQNLLSKPNLKRVFVDMVKNFVAFPPLGVVLVIIIGIGVAEQSGFIGTALKRAALMMPKSLLSATIIFLGIMSNIAVDAGYVVITPLGAMLFAAFGRHPIAGLAAAFAGVSGGFSANLLVTSIDPLLGGISTAAAQVINPDYQVQATANYYFMAVSTFVLTAVGTFVTEKIVEPRLGPWASPPEFQTDTSLSELKAEERRGLLWAGVSFVIMAILVALLVVPENAILKDEKGLAPFYESTVPLLMLIFLVLGIVYGKVSGSIKSDKDIAKMAANSLATMGGYIVLAFVASQFIAYFNWSNLGLIFAITGASFLKGIGFSGVPLILTFILVTCFINLFIGSASAKWAIMGPVFVPMLMLMGYSPELTQNAYRIGDSSTNIISPLLPYVPLIIAFARKYVPNLGMGTLFSVMIPYSFSFLVTWSFLLIIWMIFKLPLGPDVPMYYQITGP